MKLLLVLEATLGGTGRHILDLSRGLMDRGHEVHLVYSSVRADERFLAGLRDLCAAKPALRIQCLPITRAPSFSDLRCYVHLTRYVRRTGPFDIIHSHSTKAGFLARLLLHQRGAQAVYTPHGLMTLNPELAGARRRAVCWLESTLARRSKIVIANSDAERRCAIETGINAEKIDVIPNGVDPVPYIHELRERIRSELGLAPETLCVGWAGRFVSDKRPDRMLESFAILRQRARRRVHLVMLGSGPLETTLRRQTESLNLTGDVSFPGLVDGPSYMTAFDVLAHTSLFESFGYVFLEALSAGVPLVTTRVGAAGDLVDGSGAGYVCERWDPDVFAALIQRLAEDDTQRKSMSEAGQRHANRFTTTAMVDSIERLYAALAVQPHSASRPVFLPPAPSNEHSFSISRIRSQREGSARGDADGRACRCLDG